MANITMGTSPSRASLIRKEADIGPGQYNSDKRFGENTKSFQIGEKRAERIEYTQGPGAYDHEKADAVTKTKMANVTMGTSPSRASFIRKTEDIGPGQYDDGKRFNSDTKTFTI